MAEETIGRLVELLPGGFTLTTSGGTRNRLKLLPTSLEMPEGIACPFETERRGEGLNIPGIPAGWRVLSNRYTPHLKHQLVIPPTCWSKHDLQNLGGVALTEALNALAVTIANYGVETACFTNIGRAVGWSIWHHHWHAMQVLVRRSLELEDFAEAMKPERIVDQSEIFTTFAGGARGGECLIVPSSKIKFQEYLPNLGVAILHIVTLGNEKFSNPDFTVTIRVSDKGILRYADYCPVLNFWGGHEYVMALLEGSPISIPHTHKLTAKILRGRPTERKD